MQVPGSKTSSRSMECTLIEDPKVAKPIEKFSRKTLLVFVAIAVCAAGATTAAVLVSSNSSSSPSVSLTDGTPGPTVFPTTGGTGPTKSPTTSPSPAPSTSPVPVTPAPSSSPRSSLVAQFVSRGAGETTAGVGGNSGRRLSNSVPPRHADGGKGRNLASRASNGGSAREEDIEVFKLNLKEIVLCSEVPVAKDDRDYRLSSFDKMKRAEVGSYGCERIYGTIQDYDSGHWTDAVDCTWFGHFHESGRKYDCADNGTAFDNYVANLPEEDWVDLADPDFMKNFKIQAAPEVGSKFTWGWVEWRDAGIVQTKVPLDGGGHVHSKSAARADRNSDQAIQYFPTVISADDANMLDGPAEPMKYMIERQARRSVFQFGSEAVMESEGTYKLDIAYSLDRSVIVAATGQNSLFSRCRRNDAKTMMYDCGTSNLNVISLRDEGTGMEIKTPTLLPILHAADATVVKQTYMMEVDPARPGATGNFIYRSGNPWYVRLDTVYVLSADRVNATGGSIDVTADDPMYGAVISLLDYFEANDYLGDAYDFGQIRRILTIDGFNDGQPILSAGDPFYSMIGYDWRRLYNVGQQSSATVYFVEGGNAAHWCRCDMDLPLVRLLRDQPDVFPGGKEDLAATCRLTLKYNTFNEYKAAVDSGETSGNLGCPFWDEKKVCHYKPQASDNNCADGAVEDGDWCQSCCYQNFKYEEGVRDFDNGLVMTTPTDDSNGVFVWNDGYCLQTSTAYFGGLDGPCVNGEDWSCHRRYFSSVGEGCGYATQWKHENPVVYELVDEAEIVSTEKEFMTTFAPTNTPTDAPTNTPTNALTDAPTDAPSHTPTAAPTDDVLTVAPTDASLNATSSAPTDAPTEASSNGTSSAPSNVPSFLPSAAPIEG